MEAASAGGKSGRGSPAGRRVLVVDDNPDAADLLAEALLGKGQEVEIAYDGPQALRKASAFQPEVVLLDIGLPGMDGFEVARQLRLLGRNMRLIALTGYGQEADRQRVKDAGFDSHLLKPVELDALYEAVLSIP
jgi:CheY-like chemotaxis protein